MSQESQEMPHLDMAKWLAEMLAGKSCPGLMMIPGSDHKFRIPWCHRKSGGLGHNGDDAKFISAWARHKNYAGRADNKNDLSKWKENFRNALNKCCNVKIIDAEAVKNEYKVCQFTDDFLARLTTSSLQTRKRLAENCLSQNDGLGQNNSSLNFDNPPLKKAKYSTLDPQLGLKQGDTREHKLNTHMQSHFEEPLAKPSSCISPDSTSTNKDTAFLQIDVFYGSREKRLVKSVQVSHATKLCRISCCNIPTVNDFLAVEGETLIRLPNPDEIKHCHFSAKERAKINDILKDMDRGVSLKHNCRDIFIRRGTVVKVYLTDGKYNSCGLVRSKDKQNQTDFLKAFDYDKFKTTTDSYLEKKIVSCPKPWFILTVGHEIDKTMENPLDGVTVYIQVTHLKAKRKETKALNSSLDVTPALCSHYEPLDLLVNLANDTSGSRLDTLMQIPDSTAHLTATFPEDSYRTLENYTFGQTQCALMSVEVFYVSHLVVRDVIANPGTWCRIYHGEAEIQLEDDSFEKDLEVRLPSVERIKQHLPNEKVVTELKKSLNDLNLGIHLMYEDDNILADRRTVLRVFQTDGNSRSNKLPRRTMSKKPQPVNIFDFAKFSEDLSKYKAGCVKSPPKTCVFLTVGYEIESNLENPLQNVLLHVKVTHLLADSMLNNVKDARLHDLSLKYSLPDSLDRTVSCIKGLALS
ncbi:hypothetical protein Btru_001764 [Bulinus truncatus]|nr:hypothetical protein Btru_001764 [Bulinus truncatus]